MTLGIFYGSLLALLMVMDINYSKQMKQIIISSVAFYYLMLGFIPVLHISFSNPSFCRQQTEHCSEAFYYAILYYPIFFQYFSLFVLNFWIYSMYDT